MLHLPAELVLWVLAFLPLNTLRSLPQLSRHWKEFFDANESSIYHNAAIFHQFILSSATPFSDLWTIYSKRSLIDVHGWKSFCRRRFQIDRSWSGYGPSTVTEYPASGSAVHRIKVDEKAGYIITTLKAPQGGLIVSDLARNQVLWSLPQGYVGLYAHCEYDEGYFIFNNRGNTKEVWRRACDYDAAQERPTVSCPSDQQIQASSEAAEMYRSTAPRGHFKPWALLQMPELTTAFRFVYPTLLVAAFDRAYLWDIPTGRLIQTITGTQGEETLGNINYVELSKRHVFICGMTLIRIFSRTSGKAVLDIPSTQISYAKWLFTISPTNSAQPVSGSILVPHEIRRYFSSLSLTHRLIDEFVAVHVSPCGRNLAAMLASSRLVVWYDFERALRGETEMRDIALDIRLGSPRSFSKYLAFDNGRVAVATGTGLFVVQPSFDSNEILQNDDPPRLSICRAPWFGNPSSLKSITCLQMSDTGLFVNWDPTEALHDFETDFNNSLMDNPWFADLPNGDSMVLLETEDPPNERQISSVFSINFVPVPISLPSS